MLHVYLDTRVFPVTYDVIKFMVLANAVAERSNIEFIHVHIVAKEFRQVTRRDLLTSVDEKKSRVRHIFMGLCALFPKVRCYEYLEELPAVVHYPCFPESYNPKSPVQVTYGFDILEKISKSGLPVQVLRPTVGGLRKTEDLRSRGKYATMTLRTSLWDVARDGDLRVWFEAYKLLCELLGYYIYVIPDYDDVYSRRSFRQFSWDAYEAISVDPDCRVALYSDSQLNICMAGGTASLIYLLENPFITFGNLNLKSEVSNYEFYKKTATPIGKQPSWCNNFQRFDWTESDLVTPELITSESLRLLGRD